VFDFPETRKEPKSKPQKSKKLYRNPIFLAREWQEKLANGECSSRADLARKLGVSRARVTQILRLLRIDTEILKTLSELGDSPPRPSSLNGSSDTLLIFQKQSRGERLVPYYHESTLKTKFLSHSNTKIRYCFLKKGFDVKSFMFHTLTLSISLHRIIK
jgi:hypothetical protein